MATSNNSTGYICTQSGIYKCSKHTTYTIALSKGETFPPCNPPGKTAHGATWVITKKA